MQKARALSRPARHEFSDAHVDSDMSIFYPSMATVLANFPSG